MQIANDKLILKECRKQEQNAEVYTNKIHLSKTIPTWNLKKTSGQNIKLDEMLPSSAWQTENSEIAFKKYSAYT